MEDYTIRIGVSVRAFAEETFQAASWDEAVAKAKAYKPNEFLYSYEPDQGFDGDEVGYLRQADDYESDDYDVDLRDEGEPYSWVACDIVKDLARLDLSDAAAVAKIKERAQAACAKDAGDET